MIALPLDVTVHHVLRRRLPCETIEGDAGADIDLRDAFYRQHPGEVLGGALIRDVDDAGRGAVCVLDEDDLLARLLDRVGHRAPEAAASRSATRGAEHDGDG